jgi:hypothetical protein
VAFLRSRKDITLALKDDIATSMQLATQARDNVRLDAKYKKYFGDVDKVSYVKDHYEAIRMSLANPALKYFTSATQTCETFFPEAIAFVLPRVKEVNVCQPYFLLQPLGGEDNEASKAGALLHEHSHLIGTVDHKYYSAVLGLPSAKAIQNADTYRMFAE